MVEHTYCCNAKPICNGHGVCGTHVPHHSPPLIVWTHSNDRVTIHAHVGYDARAPFCEVSGDVARTGIEARDAA